MHEDLRALGSVTERDRPDPERMMRAARLRRTRERATRKEWLMSAVTMVKRRPWLATGLSALALALVLLAVPVSYERTTGHQVILTIAGSLEPARLAAIAGEFQSALGAEHVTARVESDATILGAFLPARSRSFSPALAQAFAKELGAKGYHATASTAEVKEKTSGNVYAYALSQIITVEAAGKTAAQLEAEIRRRLAEAGVPDAQVSVTDQAGGGRKVEVKVEKHQSGAPAAGEEIAVPKLQITKNGVPVAGEGLELRVEKLRGADGSTTMKIVAADGPRTATATIKNPESLGDAGLAAEIERQLSAQGITARVAVENGQIRIER
jgi:hypothetical protein